MTSNYRFLRISRTEYLSVFDDLQRQDSGFREVGFSARMDAYFAKSLVYGDSFTRAMRSLGNETLEIVCNAEFVQKGWAADKGIKYDEADWVRQIVWAQVDDFRPDVILIQGLTTNDTGFLPENGFREQFPFVKAVLGFAGFFHSADRLDGIDLVISGLPSLQRYYAANDVPTALIYHGFDAALVGRMASRQAEISEDMVDFSFVGSTGLGYGENHAVRYWELLQLCLGSELRLWANEKFDTASLAMSVDQLAGLGQSLKSSSQDHSPAEIVAVLRQSLASSSGTELPVLPLSLIFPDQVKPAVYGLDMYDALQRSRVTLNRHFDPSDGIREIGNMRTFEATGIGACMMVNAAGNAADLFEPDVEIVTFEDVGECADKVRWLLDHDDARAAIAAAGQKRTLRDHTIEGRCEVIHDIINGLI